MGIWRKRFICSSHRGMRSKGRRIWFVGWRRACMAWSRLQGSAIWNLVSLTEQGYSRCHFDHYVYFKRLDNGRYIILLLYVDEILVVGSNMHDINVLQRKLDNSFVMKDLGVVKFNAHRNHMISRHAKFKWRMRL